MLLVLGGPEHGLFRLYPVLAVALLVPFLARRTRAAALVPLGAVAAYVVLYGHWWSWHLGEGFGHRGFVEAVPFVLPALAVALSSLRPRVAVALAALGTAATVYTVVRLGLYWGIRENWLATF